MTSKQQVSVEDSAVHHQLGSVVNESARLIFQSAKRTRHLRDKHSIAVTGRIQELFSRPCPELQQQF